MAQTLTEFKNNPSSPPVELCGCGCGKPLEKNDPLGPKWMKIEGRNVLVNEDCYFEKIGEEIDEHPIGGLGIHGAKNNGSIDDGNPVCLPGKVGGGPGCCD